MVQYHSNYNCDANKDGGFIKTFDQHPLDWKLCDILLIFLRPSLKFIL